MVLIHADANVTSRLLSSKPHGKTFMVAFFFFVAWSHGVSSLWRHDKKDYSGRHLELHFKKGF